MDLIEHWRQVHREAIRFCESVERLPVGCPCGDAPAHLQERCRCCGSEARGEAGAPAETCQETLARLGADVSALCRDFRHVAAPLNQATRDETGAARRGILLAAGELQQMALELDRAGETVLGFLRTCAVSHLRILEKHAAALRTQCDRVNAAVDAGARDS